MLPEIAELEFNPQAETEDLANGKSFLFDFTANEFVLKDGKPVEAEGIEALKVWIEKTIRTEKFRFEAYRKDAGDEYGSTIEDLIGTNYPASFIEAELKREINEALRKHPTIQSVSNFQVQRDNDWAKISFTVNTVSGSFGQEVTI